jgi:hypothetical protein
MPEPMFRIIALSRKPGECRSCGAAITWALTFPNRRTMPLTGAPVALKTEHDNLEGAIEYIASADSHFVSCPDGPKWSKR